MPGSNPHRVDDGKADDIGNPRAQQPQHQSNPGHDSLKDEQPVHPWTIPSPNTNDIQMGNDLRSFHQNFLAFQDFEGPDYAFSSRTRSEICRFCRYIMEYFTVPKRSPVIPHYNDFNALKASALSGCALCAQFLRGYDNPDIRYFVPSAPGTGDLGYLAGGVNILDPSKPFKWRTIEFHFKSQNEVGLGIYQLEVGEILVVEDLPRLLKGPSVSPILKSVNTRDGLELAKQWLRKCCDSHNICATSHEAQAQVRPTRLVFVGETIPRLYISTGSTESPKYATLSHCWGVSTFLTLTRSNLTAFQERIPLEALSKTFHDAIYTAKALGINYLWIDSLCIVQDDSEDWQKESALMSSVYGGSMINIAASGAVDGNEGCFFDRGSDWICPIEAGTGDERVIQFIPGSMYSKCLTKMPLMARGWALQERLLSPRTIHLTRTEIFWECHQNAACETFPYRLHDALILGKDALHYWDKQPVTLSMWKWIVRQYSECCLTKESDKLVALSGLAKKIQLQTRDQYVAGLWREGLEKQLLWKTVSVITEDIQHRRYDSYTAPSWSWASIEGAVELSEWDNVPVKPYIKVLKVDITAIGHDPLGAISRAHICLKCDYMILGTGESMMFGDGKPFNYLKFNTRHGKPSVHLVTHLDCTMGDHWESQLVYILPVAIHINLDTTRLSQIKGLILQPTKNERGQYRRVGHFEMSQDNLDQLEAECLEYFAKDSDYQTIRVNSDGQRECIIEIV